MSTHFYTYSLEYQTTPSNYTCWGETWYSWRGIDLLLGFILIFFWVLGETKMKEQPRTPNEEAGNAATLKGGLGQSGGGVKCESVWLAGKPALGRRKTFGLLVSFWQPDICTLQLKSDQLARPQPLCSNPRRRHLAREGKISSGTYMMMSIPTPMFVSEAPPFYDFAKKKWRERERRTIKVTKWIKVERLTLLFLYAGKNVAAERERELD